jgi:uncharacterized membrane protein
MSRRPALFRTDTAETGRVEAFSDGVLAIVITLLVLEIHVPQVAGEDGARWRALLGLLPIIGAWAISFVFVLIYWVAHHYMFADLRRVDRGLLWLNGLFLFCISFMPFPAALQAVWFASRPATFLMSVVMLLAGVSFTLMRWYVSFGSDLMRADKSHEDRVHEMRRGLLNPVLYSIGVGMALIWPWVSLAIQVLVPVIYFLPARARAEVTKR